MQKKLSLSVEKLRKCAPLLLQIREGRRVVAKEAQANPSQFFPIDEHGLLLTGPQAGNELVYEIGPPTKIGSVRPKQKIRKTGVIGRPRQEDSGHLSTRICLGRLRVFRRPKLIRRGNPKDPATLTEGTSS